MNELILDTHILLWYFREPERISNNIVQQIDNSKLYLSAISCFEIVWLLEHNRITLNGYDTFESWLDDVKQSLDLTILPVTCQIGSLAVRLPEHHKDPQDRLIIASAIVHNFKLASADTNFPLYQEIRQLLVK